MNSSILSNAVAVSDGKVTTTSLKIAEVFGKRHDDVMRAVELLQVPDSFKKRNFAELEIPYKNGLGKTVMRKAYSITRDGFTLLVMGFTGAAAMRFKIAYLEEFNRMEAELRRLQSGMPVQPELPLPERSRSGIVPRMEYNGVAVMPLWEIARATGYSWHGIVSRKQSCNYELTEGTDVFRNVIITPELRKSAERAGYQLSTSARFANLYTATGIDKLLKLKRGPVAVHPQVMPPNKGELPKPELDIPRLTCSRDAITITGVEFRRRFETRDLAVKKLLVKLAEAGYDVQIEQAELAYLLAMLGRCRHMAYEFMARLETMNHQARSLADMSYNTTCQFDRNGRIGMSESASA